jgi:hypothetical protein
MPRTCWAASLGNCSKKISAEHVFSEALFSDSMLSVEGPALPFPPRVSRTNLKAKVLCTTHNGHLSDVDGEAKKLFDALRNHVRLPMPGATQVRVDGWKIERWCMKSGTNLLASRWLGTRPFLPDPAIVAIIFGDGRLPPDAGLYVVKKPVLTLKSDADRVSWNLFNGSGSETNIRAFYIQLFALGLIVTPHRGDLVPLVRSAARPDLEVDWSTAELTHRPNAMDVSFQRKQWQPNETARLTIEFAW